MSTLEDQVAVVTGGSTGIGRAISHALAGEGADIVIADIDIDAGAEAVAEITRDGGDARLIRTDVSDSDQVAALFERIVADYGRVDVLVNNAGIPHSPEATTHFLEMPPDAWHRIVDIQLNGLFYCSQQAARIMARQKRGCIINMSSGGATRAHRQMVAYDTTKGGIEAATRAMALDLAPWNIRVNALVPGAIAVETRAPVGQETTVRPEDVVPLARLGTPADVAGAAVYLASAAASYVTGHCLVIDGGLTVQLRSPAIDAEVPQELLERY